jgi:hypothetical protein
LGKLGERGSRKEQIADADLKEKSRVCLDRYQTISY